jgi:hypothetical protein
MSARSRCARRIGRSASRKDQRKPRRIAKGELRRGDRVTFKLGDRMAMLTSEQHREIGRAGAAKRWGNQADGRERPSR